MVADLMGDDVGIGEGVTLDTKLALHLGEERQVDVKLLVARAIEGSYGCSGIAAG